MKYLRYEILEQACTPRSYASLASRSIVWSLAMSRSIRDYVPVKTDHSLDRVFFTSLHVRTAKKLHRRRSRPTKNFQQENFYYESLITRKFPDLRYSTF